ncbi:MAG: BatD family protein, partial [Bradymonadia bacterium]
EVGAFLLKGEGTQTRSKPIQITVLPNKGNRPAPASSISGQTARAGEQDKIFLRWNTEATDPFVGQPFIVHLDLYYEPSLRPTHSNGLEQLDLSGFWAKKLPGSEVREATDVVNGRQYRVQRLVGYRLIPLQAGPRALPQVSMVIELSSVRRRRGGIFGRQELVPWGEVKAESPPFSLTVRALPEQGRPKDFKRTSVGATSLSAKLSQRRIRADSGVDLTIETKTTGLLENFSPIEVINLDDFEVYPGQTRTVTSPDSSGRGGRNANFRSPISKRVQTFLLRPKKTGRLRVPPISLSYFDPNTETYRTAKTIPLSVVVTGQLPNRSKKTNTAKSSSPSSSPFEFRPLSKTNDVISSKTWLDSMALFYAFFLGFPFMVLAWLLIERRRRTRERTSGYRSAVKAFKIAKAATHDLSRAPDLDVRERAKTAKSIVLEYLNTRTQSQLGGLAYDDLAVELGRRGASTAATGKLVELMETFDYEHFSGMVSGAHFEPQLDELITLLDRLEEELR